MKKRISNVAITVHIKDNLTSEIQIYKTDAIYDTEFKRPNLFIWKYGNYECDCNRQIFWYEAANKDFNTDVACGNELYSVKIYDLENNLLYKEF